MTKRCASCILPNSSVISLNQDGICDICCSTDNSAKSSVTDPLGLDEYIEKIKQRGEGRPYDCVVGLSGGRDSTYLVYLLVKRHALRILVAYYRTPFTSDTIDQNVRRLVDLLQVRLVEMDISQEYHLRVARQIVNIWRKHPDPVIANLACAPCKLVNYELFRIARMHNVPSVIVGSNGFERVQVAASQPRSRSSSTENKESLRARVKLLLRVSYRGIVLLWKNPLLWRFTLLGIKSAILYISTNTLYLKLRERGINASSYFQYAPYDEVERDSILRDVGWELPEGCNSSWRADCSFAEFKNYMFSRTIGITYTEAFLSNMIRAGFINRKEALRRLTTEGRRSDRQMQEVCKILDLPYEEFST